MTTLMIIGLIVLGWLILAGMTWALCVMAARGDAALRRGPDRTGRTRSARSSRAADTAKPPRASAA